MIDTLVLRHFVYNHIFQEFSVGAKVLSELYLNYVCGGEGLKILFSSILVFIYYSGPSSFLKSAAKRDHQ